MNYNQYLFVRLLELYNQDFSNRAYDEQYDAIDTLYEQFRTSKFNVNTQGLYECIEDYLQHKYGPIPNHKHQESPE